MTEFLLATGPLFLLRSQRFQRRIRKLTTVFPAPCPGEGEAAAVPENRPFIVFLESENDSATGKFFPIGTEFYNIIGLRFHWQKVPGTVVLGLVVLLIFYLVMVSLLGKMSPMRFLRNIREAQLLAFSTSSSAAVMPLSMETAEKKLLVEPSIVRFIIPLGATINMDGTALYQVTAAVFLTQVFWGASRHLGSDRACRHCGWRLDWDAQHAGCGHSRSVDRILDMSRTTINVTGDLTACTIMNRWLKPNR